MQKVFLCYNRLDKHFVKIIDENLKVNGIETILDENDIKGGSVWLEWIFSELEKCSGALVFIGNDGIGEVQKLEIEYMIAKFPEHEKYIIPVLTDRFKNFESISNNNVLYNIINKRDRIDFRKHRKNQFKKLVESIKGEGSEVIYRLISKIVDNPKLLKSWWKFHSFWALYHVLGYLFIMTLINSEMLYSSKIWVSIFGTVVGSFLFIISGNFQMRLAKRKANISGIIVSLLSVLTIGTLLIIASMKEQYIEQIGAISTILGTGIIAGMAGGKTWGFISTFIASSGAIIAAFLLPYLGSGVQNYSIPVIIGTLAWGYFLSLILRIAISKHKSVMSLLLELSGKN